MSEKYIENLEKRLERYHDIEKSYKYCDTEFELFAKSYIRNEKYLGTKKLTIYAFENNEYTFVKAYKSLDEKKLLQFIGHLKNATEDYVTPHDQHMSTIITGILVVDEDIDEDLKKMVKKFKHMRNFAFGLKGWAYIRLLVISVDKGEVICNKRGREIKKFYQGKN